MSIQTIRASIHSPQKAYMWEVEIQGAIAGALPDLTLFAKTASIPPSSVDPIVINHKGGKAHYAGKNSSAHTVSIAFFDDEAQTIQDFMYEWYDNYISNPSTATSADKSQYTADILIKFKDSHDESVTASWKLTKAFPTEIGEVSLSYESSDLIELPVTFSYDEKIKL